MLFAILTLLCALSVSAIAAYYSVIGLIAIFSAAPIPIAVMGGTLEAAKLVVVYTDTATVAVSVYGYEA